MSTPKLHVKSGDTVVVISGDKRNSKGRLSAFFKKTAGHRRRKLCGEHNLRRWRVLKSRLFLIVSHRW